MVFTGRVLQNSKDSKDTEYWVLVESDDCRMLRRMMGEGSRSVS